MGNDPSLGRDVLNFSHFMDSISSRSDDFILSLQKDIVYYVNSGKWANETNKLEYEMNQVALKKGIQDTISFIKALKELGIPRNTALQKVLQISNGELNRDEIEKLMEENY